MEVHHHSHTPRKKWTHYFWEFLMLFLAVFCGFLAEYQLEHKIEKERGKQYMHALLVDLVEDSKALKNTSENVELIIKGLDTLIYALQQPLSVQRNKNFVYLLYAKYGQNFFQVNFNEGTTTQLKNSGGLRLITNIELVTKFNAYESMKTELKEAKADLWRLLTNIEEDHASRFLDFTTTASLLNFPLNELSSMNTDSLLNLTELSISNSTPEFIGYFRNLVRSLKLRSQNYLNWISDILRVNIELTDKIKSVYHIK